MNLRSCFASGQVYVALSRARTLEGLHVDVPSGWIPGEDVMTDATVKIFGALLTRLIASQMPEQRHATGGMAEEPTTLA